MLCCCYSQSVIVHNTISGCGAMGCCGGGRLAVVLNHLDVVPTGVEVDGGPLDAGKLARLQRGC